MTNRQAAGENPLAPRKWWQLQAGYAWLMRRDLAMSEAIAARVSANWNREGKNDTLKVLDATVGVWEAQGRLQPALLDLDEAERQLISALNEGLIMAEGVPYDGESLHQGQPSRDRVEIVRFPWQRARRRDGPLGFEVAPVQQDVPEGGPRSYAQTVHHRRQHECYAEIHLPAADLIRRWPAPTPRQASLAARMRANEKATEKLAELFRAKGEAVRREDMNDICPGISARDRNIIWRQARERAGLPPEAPAGRKRKKA